MWHWVWSDIKTKEIFYRTAYPFLHYSCKVKSIYITIAWIILQFTLKLVALLVVLHSKWRSPFWFACCSLWRQFASLCRGPRAQHQHVQKKTAPPPLSFLILITAGNYLVQFTGLILWISPVVYPVEFSIPNVFFIRNYYMCSWGVAYLKSCPDGLYWNKVINTCDYPSNVVC